MEVLNGLCFASPCTHFEVFTNKYRSDYILRWACQTKVLGNVVKGVPGAFVNDRLQKVGNARSFQLVAANLMKFMPSTNNH